MIREIIGVVKKEKVKAWTLPIFTTESVPALDEVPLESLSVKFCRNSDAKLVNEGKIITYENSINYFIKKIPNDLI